MNDEKKVLEWMPNVEESQRHYEDFLKKYPIEKLKELTLEEYSNSNKNSFCYTLEFGIEKLGSIKGSSAYKFGIYRYNKRPDDKKGRMSDDKYAWYSRYGDTPEKAFNNILNKIVEVANAAKEFDLERIDKIDLSNMVKWKIAFLYSNYNLINIFSEDILRYLSKKYGLINVDTASFSEMYRFLLGFRNDANIFEFSLKLWNDWQKGRNDKKYYAVGSLFKSGNEDMTDYFIANNKWYDGYASNGDNRNEKILNEIKDGDILLLKSSATKGTNHDITFTRLKGLGIVIDRENDFTFKINWLKSNEIPKDFENISYRKTIELMRDDEMLRFVKNIIDNETTMNDNNNNKIQKYIDILETNKNLILTGAPGTGKTFLAKQIAARIIYGDNVPEEFENDIAYETQCKLVQFHPSYDYTDFVEGLRPAPPNKDGNIGFKREDGIFKDFCKWAAVDEVSDNEENEPKDNKYIFIIDEINRGEISKIFGELFYCIDPGYRGKKGCISTQYQNLVPEGDVFKMGFYVPKNVYIIGTMNDIDRSVESMDFAFRRRFAFMEVKADENLEMLYEELDENLAEKSKNRLINLNKKISEMEDDGLSSAYHIGASYFLKIKDYNGDFEKLWNYHLNGLLREYLRGMSNIEAKIESLKVAYDNESASNN